VQARRHGGGPSSRLSQNPGCLCRGTAKRRSSTKGSALMTSGTSRMGGVDGQSWLRRQGMVPHEKGDGVDAGQPVERRNFRCSGRLPNDAGGRFTVFEVAETSKGRCVARQPA